MAYSQSNSQGRNDRIRFDLMERIGVLSRKDNGWTREVNIVAWNDGPGKVDIREWDPDHKRMTKGVTLFEDEAEKLTEVLARRYGLIYPSNEDRSFYAGNHGRSEYKEGLNDIGSYQRHQGRSFGELTDASTDNIHGGVAGASAGEAAEAVAGHDAFVDSVSMFESGPAASAASMPEAAAAHMTEEYDQMEEAAACVAEGSARIDAAEPATP